MYEHQGKSIFIYKHLQACVRVFFNQILRKTKTAAFLLDDILE